MLNIYKKAEPVLVWLGECGLETATCLRYFATILHEEFRMKKFRMSEELSAIAATPTVTCFLRVSRTFSIDLF